MEKRFSEYRLAVRRYRTRKKRRAEARLMMAGFTAYMGAFLLTASQGAALNVPALKPSVNFVASVDAEVPAAAAAPSAPKPAAQKPKPAPLPWDRDVHALPSRGKYLRFYRMTATAYRPINRGIEGGRWTVTQRDGRSAHGVAVDPDIIPLGSRLWIPGYGHAVADDIGGWIKGHRIDIRCQDDESMDNWGRRSLRVYVLEEPAGASD
jgi:3D (Asp-Asp-Asp) domain-containing protein